MFNSLQPRGLKPTRLLCPWNFPGENTGVSTGVSCHFLLQGIFPTEGLNPCLLHWQVDSLLLSHQKIECQMNFISPLTPQSSHSHIFPKFLMRTVMEMANHRVIQIDLFLLQCLGEGIQIDFFLPGKSHGWRGLVGCSPWGCTESDMTEAT